MFFLTLRGMKSNPIPADFMPINNLQKKLDYILVSCSIIFCMLCFFTGYTAPLIFSLIIPRIIVWALHAWYICYLPHSVEDGGFEKYRIVSTSKWARFFTFEQSLHGVHHKTPNIPWHKYNSYFLQRGNSWRV